MKHREVFTIGHSDRPPERFAELLKRRAVSAVADVRSAPCGGRFPQYGKEELRKAFSDEGLKYVFSGKEFGARENSRAKCRLVKGLPLFRKGIERLTRGVAGNRLAVTLGEKRPEDCHREVCPELGIKHMPENGKLLTHEDFEKNLSAESGTAMNWSVFGK